MIVKQTMSFSFTSRMTDIAATILSHLHWTLIHWIVHLICVYVGGLVYSTICRGIQHARHGEGSFPTVHFPHLNGILIENLGVLTGTYIILITNSRLTSPAIVDNGNVVFIVTRLLPVGNAPIGSFCYFLHCFLNKFLFLLTWFRVFLALTLWWIA